MPGMFRESQVQMARSGDCRLSGQCARLRTIERSEAQRETPPIIFLRLRRALSKIALACQRLETRIARKDAMPHERGPIACAPSEFSVTPLADPNARFCCSLANRQHSAQPVPRQPVDTQALDRLSQPAAGVPDSGSACGRPRATLLVPKRRAAQLRSIPLSNRNEPERRATNILARPGRACKSLLEVTLPNRPAFASQPCRAPTLI
jgi:hypothetical protein